jgi:3-hydroxybutyryl-CoA dehydrogenase
MFTQQSIIGVVGSGAMGLGIGQISATQHHKTIIFDSSIEAIEKAKKNLSATLSKLIEKQKISEEHANEIKSNLLFTNSINDLKDCHLIIEAIIENLSIKQSVFKDLEAIVSESCVLASNTSSLSITSIASVCKLPKRVIGIHFFNPATLMPLVEIIPGIATDLNIAKNCKAIIDSWKKITVMAKDTPGFIVNRVARPYYSEALRIFEEQIADIATIDWAMKEFGGFKMGPFELMDLIGHDVNYIVTETVWTQFYFDPRFKPALSQKRLLEANLLGKKSGKGFYDYAEGAINPLPNKDENLGKYIFNRILCMLINEACDAYYLGIASIIDLDVAMTKGVNYPKGLLKWADEIGLINVEKTLGELYDTYQEDRYRSCVLLKNMSKQNKLFY